MASWKILQGDVREQLGRLPAGYAQCVVTSPPYWGLRSYMPEAVRMRDDLTEAERDELLRELARIGVNPISDVV